jgi:tripartite-type tricarboxylate transporter receptor subunit TctC
MHEERAMISMKELGGIATALALTVSTAALCAYPEKPIRLAVPNPPGGAQDVVARLITDRLGPALGQQVLVENRAGAGGVIATESVARAAPDGYTLLFGSGGTHGTNSAVFKKLTYDPVRDFAPVSLLVRPEWGLFINPSLPFKTVGELVARAKAQPGKINYASYGPGSANHLMMEHLLALSRVDMVHIPYKGSVAAQVGVIANDAQVLIDGVGNASAHVKSGKLKMIAVGSARRSPLAPDTPTILESGVPGFQTSGFFGIFAPVGTPKDVVARLHRELTATLKHREVQQWLIGQAYEIVGGSPEELAEEVAREIRKWQQLVRERNLKFD